MLRIRDWSIACACGLALLCTASVAPAQYADLEGQIILSGDVPTLPLKIKKDDPTVKDAAVCAAEDATDQRLTVNPENKGVADIFVYIRKPKKVNPDLAKPPAEQAVQDQKNCVFVPHAQVIRCEQQIIAKSQDAVTHNMRGVMISNPGFNVAISANETTGIEIPISKANKKPEPLPSTVECSIHPFMKCVWLIVDHPYAAVTDADGKFKIAGLPVGEHELTIWHEAGGYIHKTFKVTVAKDGTTIEPMEVTATMEGGEFKKLEPAK
ncbi:MAG: hypothetical protein R3B90_23325 [Planctomycetaceae bacterium]